MAGSDVGCCLSLGPRIRHQMSIDSSQVDSRMSWSLFLLLALLGKDGVSGLTFDETVAYFLNKSPEELL